MLPAPPAYYSYIYIYIYAAFFLLNMFIQIEAIFWYVFSTFSGNFSSYRLWNSFLL